VRGALSERTPSLAAAAVALGLITLGGAVILHAPLDPDESQHLHAAWLVGEGRVPYRDFWEHHMPLLAYALAPVTRRVPEGPAIYFVGRTLMGLVSVGTLALVYALGRRVGPGIGPMAVVLLAVQWRFLQHTIQVRPDSPALLAWLGAVLMLVRWRERVQPRPLVTAGLCLGVAAALTLYGLSLGVLEVAERVSGASVKTDFQRGHTALSALWGIGALALYVVGLARDIRDLRVVGLTLLGLALAKLFLYDLSSLSSITRALSFLAVGAILLAAGFFAERLVRTD